MNYSFDPCDSQLISTNALIEVKFYRVIPNDFRVLVLIRPKLTIGSSTLMIGA